MTGGTIKVLIDEFWVEIPAEVHIRELVPTMEYDIKVKADCKIPSEFLQSRWAEWVGKKQVYRKAIAEMEIEK